MKVNTRLFGEIEIADEKIISFEDGVIGFPEFKKFTLIYDEEKKEKEGAVSIIWLQSLDDEVFALPIMNPLIVSPDYNPHIEDEYLLPLGELNEVNTMAYVTVTIPSEIEKISVNLRAPIIINADTRKGAQIIVEEDFPVKYPIYQIIKKED
ncbi:MAG: flagellar assembly protein FliW [Eubacterium sp.]|nr:flagellar assembly protein FliW [Eubacterium sp.]